MKELLNRRCYDPRPTELRRLLVAVIVVLATSSAWYMIRPILIRQAAYSSVGCPSRGDLLGAALRQRVPGFPEDVMVQSHSLPRPGWVAWFPEPLRREFVEGIFEVVFRGPLFVADHRLRVQGSIAGPLFIHPPLQPPPGDIDSDGRWGIVLDYEPLAPGEPNYGSVFGWAVIRLGEESNEIVWAGILDCEVWRSRGVRVKPIWRDEDGDGVHELVFVTLVTVRLGKGRIGFKPPETVAVFEWDAPGGLFRPRLLPEDSGILPWTPPDDAPVAIAQDAELEPLLIDLLPVPEGFGSRPASQPATSPSPAGQ